MIEKLHIGFNDIENEKIYKLKLTEKQKKAIGFNKNAKTVWDYLDTYLGDKKLKEYLHDEFLNTIHKTLPKELRSSCLYCTGNDKSVLEEDRKCYNYVHEGQMNEFFALYWFINIVENNKHLLTDNKAIKNLSIKFYECFLFKNGRVFFDLRKLIMHTLEQGFLTLSKVFAQNDKINSLEIINQTIDSLDSQYLSIKMFEKTEPYHIEPQKKFFKNKRKSIKEQIKIEKLKEKQNPPQQTETNILIKLEKKIETISKQMSIFKSIESKEINVCVISKTEIFDVNLLDNYLLNQTKNQYLDARLTDLKNLCEKVKKSNENKIDASNKETLFKYEFKRTNKKTNDPECYKFSSFNESIFLLNTAELKYKKIDFNEAENHYKYGYFAKSFTKGLLALKCNEILEVLNKYLTQQTETTNEAKKPDAYKDHIWFKIGLMFANGKMQNLLEKFKNNATQIAKHLENESFRPFISESIGINSKTSDKSIFSNKDKMNKIITYCENNNIEVNNDFKRRLPIE